MPQDELFGASGANLSTVQKIKLLAEWAPLLPLLQAVALAQTNQGKALAGAEVLRWLAAKTSTTTDDAAVDHLKAMISTPEGGKVCDFIVALVGAIR